ncbi:MAG TPA: dihydrodipicolinate synthase family protein [Acidimicrobiia bacterium]|nr:dihydrodipicolinate synthase family protein [Acidimicrobiia bacterium]
MTLRLPTAQGGIESYRLGDHPPVVPTPGPWSTRTAYAAVHVVADPLGDPTGTDVVDWEATLAFRRHIWSLGLGVAEAMDTAQRGAGLSGANVRSLVERTAAEARAEGGMSVFGVTTDDLERGDHSLDQIVASYERQLEMLEDLGGAPIIMPSRALAAAARSEEDYLHLYQRIITGSRTPVMLHWLGEMFDPALGGYWGHDDLHAAADVLLQIIAAAPGRVVGVKVSVRDAELEIDFRKRLPSEVRCFTGDDFNFPRLIAGEDGHHSDALLGIFDVIAPVAATALHRLEAGDRDGFLTALEPTVPLSRHLFTEPTQHYKTGVVFLAYLTGHQSHFRMIGGQEGARSIVHLSRLLKLADRAGIIPDPELAAVRMRPLLSVSGVD